MAKYATNTELKRTAQCALRSEYGFYPALKDIVLLESDSTGMYILFRVSSHEYRFQGQRYWDGSIWCGPGTIEKVS